MNIYKESINYGFYPITSPAAIFCGVFGDYDFACLDGSDGSAVRRPEADGCLVPGVVILKYPL